MKITKNRITKTLKIGVFLLGILFFYTSCEKDEDFISETSTTTPFVSNMEVISQKELPEELLSQLTNYLNNKNLTILKEKSLQEVLEFYFEENASKITSKDGIITFGLPLKKNIH